jgi:hypothetical protein
VVRGLGTGVLRCVVRFSASFPYKPVIFTILDEKVELLPVAFKKITQKNLFKNFVI